MGSAGNQLRRTSRERATQAIYGWVALFIVAACVAAPGTAAQDVENVPVIRVDARQVLIPARIWDRVEYMEYEAVHLATHDFRLFEDGREQTIRDATLIRLGTVLTADNKGHQHSVALTPMGKWTNLDYVAGIDYDPLTIYLLAYRPPESPEGSCHTIKIKVNPKSESGDRMTTAQAGPGLWGGGN